MPPASLDQIHVELFDRFQQGGPLMWPLFLLSLAALVIFVERVLYYRRSQIRPKDFLSGIENSLGKGRLIEALTVCQETPGPAANMVKAGLMVFRKGDNEIREAVREAAVVELGPLKRRVSSLAAIAAVSPILGLLGTVTGLMDTFQRYEEQGVYVNAGHLAGGVWQALITTATGLALAAIAILAHHYLIGRLRSFIQDMDWLCQELIYAISRVKSAPVAEIESTNEPVQPESGDGAS